ncbi:MAG: hypothetical protein AABX76_01205 [Nanoarchaeota archaeon]
MTKEDIRGGLRIALSHGSTLQEAMISFFNSGYLKKDIEDAASELDQLEKSQNHQIPQTNSIPVKKSTTQRSEVKEPQTSSPKSESSKSSGWTEQKFDVSEQGYSQEEEKPKEEYPPLQQQQTIQKVSKYGGKPSPVGAAIVFILVFFLLFLVGILISVFLFKDELASFFNSFL